MSLPHFAWQKTFVAAIFFLSAVFPLSASATTYFSGTIQGDVTFTKEEGPYVVEHLSIPAGTSLTISPGTVVKMKNACSSIGVDGGTFTVGGDGERTFITSFKDDSVGGDTNEDGTATTPYLGDWCVISVSPGSVATFTNTEIRYGAATPANNSGGYYVLPVIDNQGGTITIDRSTITRGVYYGLRQQTGTTTIINSTFSEVYTGALMNGGYLGVEGSTFDGVGTGIITQGGTLRVKGNTFRNIASFYALNVNGIDTTFLNELGNTGDGAILFGLTLTRDLTLHKDGLPYAPGVEVRPGATLTVDPGVIFKVPLRTFPFIVKGTLIFNGTKEEPITVTSWNDDTVGGDMNDDGTATVPAEGDWRSIVFYPGSHGTVAHTLLRYGGQYEHSMYWGTYSRGPAISNEGGDLTVTDTRITNSAYEGIKQTAGTTTMLRSEIAHTLYGFYLLGQGPTNSGGRATIHDSSIHDNYYYGLYTNTAGPIDAKRNWWGSASGPTHPSNPGGEGDIVSDGVDWSDWLRCDPFTESGTNVCASNVLFLPGIMGSRLYWTDPDCALVNCENKLWLANKDSDAEKLYMATGTSRYADIYAKDGDVLFYGGPFNTNFYISLKNDFDLLVTSGTIAAWTPVAYDWRYDYETLLSRGDVVGERIYYDRLSSTEPYILKALFALASSSKTGKVTIVAHSNGGLLAKALVQKLEEIGKAELVDSMILVASPQLGTPQALGALLHGYNPNWAINRLVEPRVQRILAHDMPMTYNLLPSERYLGLSETPVVEFDSEVTVQHDLWGDTINNTSEYLAFLFGFDDRLAPEEDELEDPAIANDMLISRALEWHRNFDRWVPPENVKLYQIAGWGIDTASGIKYVNDAWFGGFSWGYEPMITEDGDGTVVTPSALALSDGERYWVDLFTENEDTGNTFDHGDILELPQLRSFILKNLLTHSTTTLPQYFSTTRPPVSAIEKRLRYYLYSPLALSVIDTLGNEESMSTSTFRGAHYAEFGEVKYLSVPASSPHRLVLTGYASGEFTLKIEEITGGVVIASTTFAGVPSSTSTIVTMEFSDGTIAHASDLRVDGDGDGATDLSLTPKLNDVVIPTAQKYPLTVSANNETMILGGTIPALSATLSGFVNGDTATSSVHGSALCTTTATSESAVGVYPISCTLGTLNSEKYDFVTFATGTLTIIYRWYGFLQPINDPALHPMLSPSVFKGGATVPIKLQLKNMSGTSLEASASPTWLSPQRLTPFSASVNETVAGDGATGWVTYRYDPTAQQYVYSWSTKGVLSGYWYRIFAKLDDGTVQSVVVGLR